MGKSKKKSNNQKKNNLNNTSDFNNRSNIDINSVDTQQSDITPFKITTSQDIQKIIKNLKQLYASTAEISDILTDTPRLTIYYDEDTNEYILSEILLGLNRDKSSSKYWDLLFIDDNRIMFEPERIMDNKFNLRENEILLNSKDVGNIFTYLKNYSTDKESEE